MLSEMTLSDVHWFLDLFDTLDIKPWIDGGWGVDALLGKQTRKHADLDIIIETAEAAILREALFAHGFTDIPTDDRSQWNYVMGDAAGRLIDFHLIEIAEDGRGIYGPPENDVSVPAEALQAKGAIGGRSVRCLMPEYQVQSHTGYRLKPKDFADMQTLREKFGVTLLPEQVTASE